MNSSLTDIDNNVPISIDRVFNRVQILVYNTTTNKVVKDEDGNECRFNYLSDAVKCLQNVNQMKLLNPNHANDYIILRNVLLYE